METIAKQEDHVRKNTSAVLNNDVDRQSSKNIKRYSKQGSDALDARIKELDREWDIERTLELNAATLSLTGVLLGAFVHRRFLILPAVVASFLIQHAVRGWCPPVEIFRRMGFRTRPEIDREKYALKAIRGDFRKTASPNAAWKAVNK